MSCGIYKIVNLINNKIYIGQSTNIEKRWISHKNNSFNENLKDYNLAIHKAIRKYGVNNFIIEIVEECDKDSLNEREKYWIKYFNSYNNGYNMTYGGDNPPIKEFEIECYDLNGNFIKKYRNAEEASKELNIPSENIRANCRGEGIQTKGYQWKESNSNKKISKVIPNQQKNSKRVAQINIETKEIINIFDSYGEAMKYTGIDRSSIGKCCSGKQKQAGNYEWRNI